MKTLLWAAAVAASAFLLLRAKRCSAAQPGVAQPALLPMPQHVVRGEVQMPLARKLQVQLTPPSGDGGGDDQMRVGTSLAAFAAKLARQAGAPGALAPGSSAAEIDHVTVHWQRPGQLPQALDEDESYRLVVAAPGITIEAASPLGVLHALTTLDQCVQWGGGRAWIRSVEVVDRPRFRWRGVLLDTARHFVPVAGIEAQLRAMQAVKMNVFHWHLTDDQAFRLESRIYPRLHQDGAQGGFYSQQEVRHIVAYARLRGIRVVPEIDMPAHTESWLLGYPELASAVPPQALSQRWGVFDAALNPAQAQTYTFVDNLLGEVAGLFPDAYLHIGGDEVTGKQWQQNAEISAFMRQHNLADKHALQGYFVHRVAQMAAAHGKKVVGWDEITQPNLPDGTIIQAWRNHDALHHSLAAGYGTILSSGYYLGGSAYEHYQNDPGASFAADLPEGLMGGEVCQWSELVPAALLDASLWPRAAAVAERLWSPAEGSDAQDLYLRLGVQSLRLAAIGVDPALPQRRLLARLLVGVDNAPFTTLAQYLAAKRENWWPKFSERRAFTQFADALYPESAEARHMRELAAILLAETAPASARHEAGAELGRSFTAIDLACRDVLRLSANRAALQDAHALAQLALETAALGQAALAAHAAHVHLPAAAILAAKNLLARQEDRDHGAAIAFAPAVAYLVEAVSAPQP